MQRRSLQRAHANIDDLATARNGSGCPCVGIFEDHPARGSVAQLQKKAVCFFGVNCVFFNQKFFPGVRHA